MARLIGLVKPLTGYMFLAIFMGLIGHLCAAFITIFGGYAVLDALEFDIPLHPHRSVRLCGGLCRRAGVSAVCGTGV